MAIEKPGAAGDVRKGSSRRRASSGKHPSWRKFLPKTPLDTIYQIETPEGVELTLHVAGPVVRFLAFLIDYGIRLGIQIIILLSFSFIHIFGNWLILIVFFLLEWFYPVVFEIFQAGKTPGKKLMGLQVIMQNGTPVNGNASMLRNLLRAADGFLVTYAFGLITMMFTKGFKRLGDLAAGTIVVYSRETHVMTIPRSWKSSAEVRPLPPTVPLSLEEQMALVSFAGRISMLGKQRAEELARIVIDQMGFNSLQEKDPLHFLLSLAAWVRGQSQPVKSGS
jgi:uncharacterized RDD family membrane protein YckC